MRRPVFPQTAHSLQYFRHSGQVIRPQGGGSIGMDASVRVQLDLLVFTGAHGIHMGAEQQRLSLSR